MKINLRQDSFSGQLPEFFKKILKEHIQLFAKEYDISIQNANTYISSREGIKMFCKYLSKNKILNAKHYILNSNGEVIAEGFHIDEDALYTNSVIKYS